MIKVHDVSILQSDPDIVTINGVINEAVVSMVDHIDIYKQKLYSSPPHGLFEKINTHPIQDFPFILNVTEDDEGSCRFRIDVTDINGSVFETFTDSVLIRTGNVPVGRMFGNYIGNEILTADDIRNHYCYGLELVTSTGVPVRDVQIYSQLRIATREIERLLSMELLKKRVVTQPEASKIVGIDYEIEDDPYPFDQRAWKEGLGLIQLRFGPLISIEKCLFTTPTDMVLLDLADWARIDKKSSKINFFPRRGSKHSVNALQLIGSRIGVAQLYSGIDYPHGFKVDYTVGYNTVEEIDITIINVIGKLTTIQLLVMLSDAHSEGVSSMSMTVDSITQSVGTTASTASLLYQPRINQYKEEIREWLSENRRRNSRMPLGVI